MKSSLGISPLIQSNAAFLDHVRHCARSPLAVKALIANANDEQLLCFVEMSLNILKGRVPLHKKYKRKLAHYAHVIRKLARVRSSKSAKRLLLPIQNGRGVPMVAGVLASLLVPLIIDAINK